MNNTEPTSTTKIGLRNLSEADIEFLSEAIYDFAKDTLSKHVPERMIDSYDIILDLDYVEDELLVDIDIILNVKPRLQIDEEKIIQDTLEETFTELDKLLKEKFSH